MQAYYIRALYVGDLLAGTGPCMEEGVCIHASDVETLFKKYYMSRPRGEYIVLEISEDDEVCWRDPVYMQALEEFRSHTPFRDPSPSLRDQVHNWIELHSHSTGVNFYEEILNADSD